MFVLVFAFVFIVFVFELVLFVVFVFVFVLQGLGARRECMGYYLGPFGALLGPSWGISGRLEVVLGAFWVALGWSF